MDPCDHFYFSYAYLSSAENPQPFEWRCSANHTVLRAAGMGAGCAEEALCNPNLARRSVLPAPASPPWAQWTSTQAGGAGLGKQVVGQQAEED